MNPEQSENDEYDDIETLGGYFVCPATDQYRTSIALILTGERQAHAEVALHSCTLESGDQVYSFSSIGTVRKKNQDRLLIYPDHSYLFLADGYGEYGDLIAEVVARYSMKHATQSLENIATKSQRNLTEVANDLEVTPDPTGKKKQKGGIACGFIRIQQDEQSKKKTMNYLRIGDVNIAILRKGKVKRRTIDETKEQIMLAHGSSDIDARENAHIIVNAICAEEDILACDPQNFDLQKGDIVIIGCDGVMKGLSNQDLESAIANRTPKEMTAWLASKGFEGYDNITASVIDIT